MLEAIQAFGRHLPPCPIPAWDQNNSHKTATKNHFGGNHPDGDGDEPDNDNPRDPDDDPPEDDDGPGNHPNDHDGSNNDVQHNLADTIPMLARSMQHQGDGSCLKVQEPDLFDSTGPSKLCTFLVQLQLSFNKPLCIQSQPNKIKLCYFVSQRHCAC